MDKEEERGTLGGGGGSQTSQIQTLASSLSSKLLLSLSIYSFIKWK